MSISSSIRDMINKTNNAAKNTANKAQSTIKGGGSSSNQGGSSGGSSKPSSGGSSSGGSSGSSSSSSSSKGSSSSSSSYRPSRGGSSSSSSSDRAYREYQEALAAQKAAAEAAQKAKIDSAVSRLEGQRPSIYQNAEAAAKQAYINKMLAQRDMAQQMAATGLSGGLTDSALLAMNSDYENSHNAILQNQNNALNELSTNINQIKAGGDLSLAELESQYQANLAQQAAQEMARRQEKQDQMDLLAYQAQMQGSPSLEEGYANPSAGWKEESEDSFGGNLSNKGILLRQALRMEYGRNNGLLGKKNAQDFVIKRVQTAYQSGQISYADAQAILRDYGLSVR